MEASTSKAVMADKEAGSEQEKAGTSGNERERRSEGRPRDGEERDYKRSDRTDDEGRRRERDDYRRNDDRPPRRDDRDRYRDRDDRDRRRDSGRDDRQRDSRDHRRSSPGGRDHDRGDRSYGRNGDDRRRDFDRRGNGDDSRRRERDYDEPRSRRRDGGPSDERRRRSSRSPPSSARRNGDEGRAETSKNGASTESAGHGLPPLVTETPQAQQEVKQFVPPTKDSIMADRAKAAAVAPKRAVRLIEVTANDRLGGKVRVKCSPKDTVGDLKKLIAVQKGTKPEKIVLKKWYTIYKDHIALEDYEIHDGMSLEMS